MFQCKEYRLDDRPSVIDVLVVASVMRFVKCGELSMFNHWSDASNPEFPKLWDSTRPVTRMRYRVKPNRPRTSALPDSFMNRYRLQRFIAFWTDRM